MPSVGGGGVVQMSNNEEGEATPSSYSFFSSPSSSSSSSSSRIIRVSKLMNLVLYIFATMITLGAIFVGVPAYGVYGDDYLWMKYQVREI